MGQSWTWNGWKHFEGKTAALLEAIASDVLSVFLFRKVKCWSCSRVAEVFLYTTTLCPCVLSSVQDPNANALSRRIDCREQHPTCPIDAPFPSAAERSSTERVSKMWTMDCISRPKLHRER